MNFPTNLADWISVAAPQPKSSTLSAANFSDFEWRVFLQEDGEQVGVEPFDESQLYDLPLPFSPPQTWSVERIREGPTDGSRYITPVENGYLVGFNKGEWGGSLWWCSSDGSDFYHVTRQQVVGFLPTRIGLLALEGLAHLNSSRGQLLHLKRNAEGRWTSEPFLRLPGAPDAGTLQSDGSLLVVTTRELLRIHLDKRVDVLLQDQFWWCLYPNSVVVTSSGIVYIGMRHGVVRARPGEGAYVVEWLLPNQEFANAKAES